jgi:hypothetical protein
METPVLPVRTKEDWIKLVAGQIMENLWERLKIILQKYE